MLEFYKKYQPEKINVVDIVIEQWNGNGKDLLNILHQRYCNDEYIEDYQEKIIETTNNNKENSINENNTTIGESTTLDRISISPIKLFVTEPNNINNQLDQQNDVNLRKSTVSDNTIESNTTIMLNTQTEETPIKINENNNKTIEDTPFICKNAFSNHIIDNYLKKEDKLSPSSPCLPNTENSGIISLEKQNSSENKISDEKNINSSGFSDESTIILPITEKPKENNNNTLLDLVKIELFPVKEESINTSLNESNQNTTKDDNSSDKNDNLNQSTFLTNVVEDVSTSKNKKSKSAASKNKKSKSKSTKRNNNDKNPALINNEDNLNEKKGDDEDKNIIEKESVSESIKSTIGKKNMLKKLDDCVSEEYINIRNEQSDDGNKIKLSTDNKRKRINKNSPRKKAKKNVNSDDYHVLYFYIDCFYWYI